MLTILSKRKTLYRELERRSASLEEGIRENLKKLGLNLTFNRVGSMFTLFFTEQDVTDYPSAKSSDTNRFARYFNAMLEERIYLPPSQFESAFLSTSHSVPDIEKTITANLQALDAACK
jgi:glutamate-1-semialdehyde 2,1-aminomutase